MSINLGFMCSGRGSNLRAILQAVQDKRLDAHASIVICNDPAAKALSVAKEFGVRAVCIPSHGLARGDHEQQVLEVLETEKLDFLVLAGYMRILSESFLQNFKDERGFFRVVNIHPSLLPAFPGKSAYEDAFNYGVRLSGITIHLVDEKVDHGFILAQEAFPRHDDDTLATFKARGLAVEHKLFPETLQTLADGQLSFLSRELVQP
ncbi:MAG TPA: phosphoribosylglycinamide formyltransferase [Oculatellaceae cyanobacterium]